MNKTTQNSEVSMKTITLFRASAKDTNLTNEEATYYAIIKQILELDYHDFKQEVFNCDWVRIGDAHRCKVDLETNLIYVNLGRIQRNVKEDDEPFILTAQATQVFYCKDHNRPIDEWHVVLEVLKRLNEDVDAFEDPFVFLVKTNENALASALRDDIIGNEEGHQ